MPLNIIAILTPKPDRVARVEELARDLSTYVKENEPDTLKYEWHRSGTAKAPKVVVIESYTDKAALDKHMKSAKFAAFNQTEKKEGNFAAGPQILFLDHFGGFARASL